MFGILCPDNVLNIFDMQYYNWKQMIGKRAKVQSVCEKWVGPGVYIIDAINTTEITEFSKELNSYSKHKAFFFKISLVETQTQVFSQGTSNGMPQHHDLLTVSGNDPFQVEILPGIHFTFTKNKLSDCDLNLVQ